MKSLLGACSLALATAWSAQQAHGCSLMDGPAAELKRAMLPHIVAAVNRHLSQTLFTAEDVLESDLSDPSVIFLDGLSSSCEGLATTIRVSSYHFKRPLANGSATCEVKGVMVMRGFWLNASNLAFHPRLDTARCEPSTGANDALGS